MTALALYQIANQFRELEALATTEDLPPEVIRDTLESLSGELQDKAVNVARFVLNVEATADAIDEAAKAMQERSKRARKRADSIRAYLLFNMQTSGITRIDCPEFTLNVRKNPESVHIEPDADIPPDCMVQPAPPPARPDKKLLKARIKSGVNIPGVWLESGDRLEVAQ